MPIVFVNFFTLEIMCARQAERFYIDFIPDQWRYYYETVHLISEHGETLAVPIHAYPVMNQKCFPTEIDFGACALWNSVFKSVELNCDVAAAFEYRIILVKAHPQFKLLTPLSGVVPAGKSIQLRVRFRPITLGTSSMQVLVEISQLDSEPHLLNIMGNAVPGAKRQQVLDLAGIHRMKAALGNKRRDSEVPSLRHCTDAHEISDSGRKIPRCKSSSRAEYMIEGLRVPIELRIGDQWSASYILTQSPGKPMPDDLKQTIDAQRARGDHEEGNIPQARMGEKLEDAALGLNVDSIFAKLASPLLDLKTVATNNGGHKSHLDEIDFLRGLADLNVVETEREFRGSEEFLGEQLLSVKERDIVESQAKRISTKLDNKRRSKQRLAVGPVKTLPRLTANATRPVSTLSYLQHIPASTFNLLAQGAWEKRAAGLRLLIALIGRWIIRKRASKRLIRVKARVNYTRAKKEDDLVNCEARGSTGYDERMGGGSKHNKYRVSPNASQLKMDRKRLVSTTSKALLKYMPDPKPIDLEASLITSHLFPRREENAIITREPIVAREAEDIIDPNFDNPIFCTLDSIYVQATFCYISMELSKCCCHFPVALGGGPRDGAAEDLHVRTSSELKTAWGGSKTILEKEITMSSSLCANWNSAILLEAEGHGTFDKPRGNICMPFPPQKNLAADSDWTCLRGTRYDVTMQHPTNDDEASSTWPLQPMPLNRKLSLAAKVAAAKWAATANAYPYYWPTVSDHWCPRLERRASGLHCLSEQHHICSWAVETAMPRPLLGSDVDDALSESESEDESVHSRVSLTTMKQRKSIFSDVQQAPRQPPGIAARSSSTEHCSGQISSLISDLPRDRAHLELVRKKQTHRTTAESLLRVRIGWVADCIHCPLLRDQFVSNGTGMGKT